MDGRFVPNITIGPPVVHAARGATKLPLDVHLMIVEPERYVADFIEAGASIVTVHDEAPPHRHRTVQQIKSLGAKAGVALNPHTSEESIRHLLGDLDLILVMSVNPGFGGQSFIPAALKKLRALRAMLDAEGLQPMLEVDGGITNVTAPGVLEAGANVLVAGSAVYGAAKREAPYEQRVEAYRGAIGALRPERP